MKASIKKSKAANPKLYKEIIAEARAEYMVSIAEALTYIDSDPTGVKHAILSCKKYEPEIEAFAAEVKNYMDKNKF
jgi:hypothetical protein